MVSLASCPIVNEIERQQRKGLIIRVTLDVAAVPDFPARLRLFMQKYTTYPIILSNI
jgi:hypothetical protein